MVMCYTIPANKANRLFWLGRYTERVYISLHLLRRYYDRMIDGQPKDYEEFYQKLDFGNPNSFVVNSSQGGGFKDTWVMEK